MNSLLSIDTYHPTGMFRDVAIDTYLFDQFAQRFVYNSLPGIVLTIRVCLCRSVHQIFGPIC